MICCIAGMHRSGTSLVAAWLNGCGLTLANRVTMAPSIDNPRGYFEDVEFVDLHKASLLRHDRQSCGWKTAPARSLDFSPGEVLRAHQLIASRREKSDAWGWKDPRTTLFLPAWKSLVPELKAMLVWRPCAHVVGSLWRRWRRRGDRFHHTGLAGAIRLWQAHNLLLCQFAETHPQDSLVLNALQIVQADKAVLALLNNRFSGSLVHAPIHTVYDPALLHQHSASLPLRCLCATAGCHPLEARLIRLSPPDVPQGGPRI